MPEKKIVQDMVPVRIRKVNAAPSTDIVRPLRQGGPERNYRGERSEYNERQERPKPKAPDPEKFRHFKKPKRPRNPRRRKIWLIILITIICIGVILAAITYVYAKAVVIITPKSEQVTVKGTFTAAKDSSSLPYEVIQTQESASTTVPASQGPLVENKAWGMIVIYNAYSTASIKLPVGTLLSNDVGLLYTTASAVTVPGIHKAPVAGNPNATSTGSASVYIVAQQPGSQYDIAPTDLTGDFNVVSFQNSAKYNLVYGRLKSGKSIIGGYTGYQEIVATSTLQNATANLNSTVSAALVSDLKALVPQGYVLYNGAYGIHFASTTVTMASSSASSQSSGASGISNTATLSLQGSLYGIMFKKTDLAKAIAPAQVAEFPPNLFNINGIESLTFTPTNPLAFQTNIAGQTGAPITFNLSGSFSMVGTFPTDTLSQGLAGLSLAQSKAVFAKYSTIMSAHAILTPFWKRSFPNSPSKITIDIQQ